MTEGEENIIIKGVLLEAISRDFSEELSNNKEVSVSPRFKRQMMAMMNNPNKWAERHKRDYRMRFEYMRVEEGSAIIIDAENMEVTEIGVNGCPGHLYISVDPEQSNCITWYDNGAKMQFIIDGFLEGNELQKMAASVLQVD